MTTVLTGVNQYAVNEKLAKLKVAFIKKHSVEGVEQHVGEQLTVQDLPNLLGGATLFASSRLVIIKDVSLNKQVAEQLMTMLPNISGDTELVLLETTPDKRTVFYKTLKKLADVQEFTELDEHAVVGWIQETVKTNGGTIEKPVAQFLYQFVGSDQLRLSNEIEKLVSFDPNITKQSIEDLVEKRPEDTIFQLLELTLGGKTAQAVTVLENLERAHEDPFQVANMLIWQTHILAVVSSAGSVTDGEVAKAAKINPFVVRKTQQLTRTISKSKLRQILEQVAQLDVRLKTSSSDPWRVVEQAIISL